MGLGFGLGSAGLRSAPRVTRESLIAKLGLHADLLRVRVRGMLTVRGRGTGTGKVKVRVGVRARGWG